MASELERLLLSFEADTRKLREALSTAESGVEKFERQANRSLGGAEKRFAAFESRAVGSLKAVGAALLAQATVSNLYSNVADVAALEKTAKVAGLSAEKLQELRAAARAAGLENSELDQVMTKFAVTMGEFRSRTGDFYEFLRMQLPTVEAQLRLTKDQDAAFNVVAEAVRRLQSAEDKALFTKKALGESSVLLVNALSGGTKGLKEAADAADNYGQIVSEQAVKNTAALKKEIDSLGASITASFQEQLGRAAPALTEFLKTARDKLSLFNSAARMAFGAERVIQEAQKPAKSLGDNFGRLAGAAAAQGFKVSMVEGLKILPKIPDFSTELDFQAADALSELARKHAEAVGDSGAVIRLEYEKEVEAFRRMLAEKKITEAEFQTAREQLSISMGARIKEAYDKETEAIREQLDSVKSTLDNSLGKGIEDILRTGKTSFADMVRDMTVNLAKLAIQAQITKPILDSLFRPGGAGGFLGGGQGSDIMSILSGIGSAIGGFRAAGGPVSAGKPYVVGEQRPEVFVPNTSGRILPAVPQGGGTINIDARGADIGVEQRLRAMFAEMQRNQTSPVEALARSQKRFPTRKAA